jgi:hypothetical protein
MYYLLTIETWVQFQVIQVRFLVDKVALELFFPGVLSLSPANHVFTIALHSSVSSPQGVR